LINALIAIGGKILEN